MTRGQLRQDALARTAQGVSPAEGFGASLENAIQGSRLQDAVTRRDTFVEMGSIEVKDEAGIAVLALSGEHDVSTARTIAAQIDRLIDSGSRIVVDLADAGFVDSTVVGALVGGHQRVHSDGREHDLAAVVAPHTAPHRTWSLLGLDQRVPTFPTRREAITAVSRG